MFNLSTLSGINLQTDNYFQYTSGRNLTLEKRLCVSMITQGRFTENSFTFYFKRKGVFFRSINSVFFNGSHHIVTPSKLQPKQLPH